MCAYTPPPMESMSPVEYFSMFFSDEMIDEILLETNRYAMTKDNRFIDVTKQEIYSYLSITLYMGIIRLPSYKLYWEKKLNYTLVLGKMSKDRFTLIRRYLHFNEKSKCKPKTDPGHDRLFKVRLIVELLWENLTRTEPEERHSIDEQIIPFKARSVMRQYLPNKPYNGGFKVFTRAGSSGITCDIEIYQGWGAVEAGPFSLGGDVVMRLLRSLKPKTGHKIFFDNLFSSVDLVVHLKEIGYDCVGTIRKNRLSGC